jgi:Secretion system C-terminal sorting domain
MKKQLLFAICMVLQTLQMSSQTAISNCDQVIVTDPGAGPTRTTNGPLLLVKYGRTDEYCNWVVARSSDYDILRRVYTLYQIIGNDAYYVESRASTSPPTFSNLPVGTYEVKISDPQEETGITCSYTTVFGQFRTIRAPFRVYNVLGQFIGYRADSENSTPGGPFGSPQQVPKWFERTTNRVVVGQSRIVDNVWEFWGQSGIWMGSSSPPPFALYGPTDVVKLNGMEAVNYDGFWLAIFETNPDGSSGRSTSLGGAWQNEQIGIRNLSEIWARGGPAWTFNIGSTYKVQLAISSNSCPSWAVREKTFMICNDPQGSCRIGGEKLEKITISPNPASDKFQLNGIDFSTGKTYRVTISDMSGKEIEAFNNVTSNEFNTIHFANGAYIVNLMADNRRLFSSKLIVNK